MGCRLLLEGEKSFLYDDFPSLQVEYEQVKLLSNQCRESVKNWNLFLKRKIADVEGMVQFLSECDCKLHSSEKPPVDGRDFMLLMAEEFLPGWEQYLRDLADFEKECVKITARRGKLVRDWEQMREGYVLFRTERQLDRHQKKLTEWKVQRWNLEMAKKKLLTARNRLIETLTLVEQLLRQAIGADLDKLLVMQNRAAEAWNRKLKEAREKYVPALIGDCNTLPLSEDSAVITFNAAFSCFQEWDFQGPIMNATRVKLGLPSELMGSNIPSIPKDLDFNFKRAEIELANKWIHYVFWSLAAAGIVILTTAIFVSKGDGAGNFL